MPSGCVGIAVFLQWTAGLRKGDLARMNANARFRDEWRGVLEDVLRAGVLKEARKAPHPLIGLCCEDRNTRWPFRQH